MTSSVEQLAARQIRLWEALKEVRVETAPRSTRRPALTISRQAGIDALTIAGRLAERLHYSIWDQELIDYVASSLGVRRQLVESLEEQKQGAVERWVEGALRQHLVDTSDYARTLVQVLRALGEQGGVVVIGRGSNFVLPVETTVRIRLVAPLDWRAERTRIKSETKDQAHARIAELDARRGEFVRRVMKADPGDATAYDLLLNVSRFTPDVQERLILEAIHGRLGDI